VVVHVTEQAPVELPMILETLDMFLSFLEHDQCRVRLIALKFYHCPVVERLDLASHFVDFSH